MKNSVVVARRSGANAGTRAHLVRVRHLAQYLSNGLRAALARHPPDARQIRKSARLSNRKPHKIDDIADQEALQNVRAHADKSLLDRSSGRRLALESAPGP